MLLPGRLALKRNLITNLLSPAHQTQPNGIDLTVKEIFKWTSAGVVDFDNSQRKTSDTEELHFPAAPSQPPSSTSPSPPSSSLTPSLSSLHLQPGAYLLSFHENINLPLSLSATIYVRSTLFRSGALITSGVIDSGYSGPLGAMLQVCNPHGLVVYERARVAQVVFWKLSESVRDGEGYRGVYQGREMGGERREV